ncbi:MAG: RNA polymerase sigma factor [Tissierella sp.]|uniref:RNA polymerase sigma factor n=1 Tax=Tissierella sp. TaxID=41274 RepID=UPI003F9EA8FE
MEDSELINLYWDRSENAISETDKKYGNYCRKISYNILYNIEDSQECVNDTYLNAWNAIPDDRPNIFSAYLGKITRNLSINIYNHKKAKKRGAGQVEIVLNELENIVASKNNIDREIEATLITETLNEFLWTLKKEYRIVFVRRYWYVDSIKDISRKMSISESKIKSILFRTRKKLKIYLEEEEIYL